MFNEVFHENRSLEHWYWKYRDHPWGPGAISLTESEKKQLAAHYGGYPVLVSNFSGSPLPESFRTYHLGDKMSRPEFRGAGFRKKSPLARAFKHFQENHAQDIPFGYGFGTGHSLRLGRLLFDYMDVEGIPFRGLDSSAPHHISKRKPSALLYGIRVEQLSSAGSEFDDFFYRIGPDYSCLTTRSSAYLNWRYLFHPDKHYTLLILKKRSRLAGWSVFHRAGPDIEWVDGLFDPRFHDWVPYLLNCLQTFDEFKEAKRIICWFPSRPKWWDSVLDKMGFCRLPEPSKLHLTGPVFNYPGSENFLRANFYYTMGDSDLY